MKLLICGKLYDGIKDELQENMSILVENNKIKAVGKNLVVPENCETIDLSHLTVTPGMIDAHVHMDLFDWKFIGRDKLKHSTHWAVLAAAHCAKKTLHRGFTSIRNVGGILGAGYGILEVRDAITEGWYEGSRIVCAPYYLGTTGSHGDSSQAFARNTELSDFMENCSPNVGNGKEFFREQVRHQVKGGADFIKIMATGGFATPNDSPIQQQLSDDELKSILNTSKELGMTVTAHAYTPELIQKLIHMGIDGIEHGAMMDEETAHLFENTNTYLVPTFCPYDEIINLDENALSKKSVPFQRKLRKFSERLVEGRKVIINSKIKIGYGTDFVSVHNPYDCGYEYDSMMRSGMEPFRILKAATKTNSEILGLPDVGTIEPGKLADIAGWKKDLLTDPKALLDCGFVMKDGIEYQPECALPN